MTKTITFLLLLCFSFVAAQTPDWVWGRNIISSNGNATKLMAKDGDGNVYIASSFTNSEEVVEGVVLTNTLASTSDIYVVKYDTEGTMIWVQKYSGTSNDLVFGITADDDGNLYMIGRAQAGMDFGNEVSLTGSYVFFIAKFDSNGAAQWATTKSGADEAFTTNDIRVDALGNVYVAGTINTPTVTFGTVVMDFPQYNYTNNSTTSFVAKFDSTGTCLWAKNAQPTTANQFGNEAKSLAVDSSGNVYVAGTFYNNNIVFDTVTMTKAATNNYNSHMYILKYNSDGVIQWGKHAGNNTYNKNTAGIAISCNDEAAYVSGYFAGSATFDTTVLTTNINIHMFNAKYDVDGNVLWAKKPVMTAGATNVSDSDIDASGNFYVAGQMFGSAIDFGNGVASGSITGTASLFLLKMNAMGESVWVRKADNTDLNHRVLIECINENEIYLASVLVGPSITLGSIILNNPEEGYDVFVSKLLFDPLAVNENDADISMVWPNPARESINITYPGHSWKYTLYNLLGQEAGKGMSDVGTASIATSWLQNGTYILSIQETNGRTVQQKVVIAH